MAIKATPTPPKSVDEALDLLNYFYGFGKDGDPDQYLRGDDFREDIYRLIVLQFHMAIESILREFIYKSLPKRQGFSAKENKKYVNDLRSAEAIDLACRLGIINKNCHEKLAELNTIRNKCAHSWVLHSFKMRPYAKSKTRNYIASFNGKSLLNPGVMKDEFIPRYADIYIEFFAVKMGVRHRRKYLKR